MNILTNPNVSFTYAGLFQSSGVWIHPRKTEATYEIIYVTSGEVCMREGEREIEAKAGQLFILSPGICHFGTKECEGVSFYWLHFTLAEGGELPFEKRFFESFEGSYLFKELLHCNNLPSPPEYLVNSVLMHILSELCRRSEEDRSAFDGRAEKIYEWIRINATASLTVGKVADRFGYSADHITRICKKYFGMSACELINRFLMDKARSALANTDRYVKEIGAELGFADDKAFVGYFRYHEGCFPTEFRNRFGRLHMNSK